MSIKRITSRFLLYSFVLAATGPAAVADTVFESFETGFGRWTDHSHLPWSDPQNPPALEYSVTRSQERAHDGQWSLDFTANGQWDDGTVWIQRAIRLAPGQWELDLEFQFYSSYSDVNNWRVVGYIDGPPPTAEEDFTFLGYAGIEGWSAYGLQHTVVVSEPSTVYIALGYSINWETWRTHWFDSVTITGVPPQPAPADVNADGLVDVGDLLLLLSAWGGHGNADVNGDGVVDVLDLLELLAAWGPC